MEKKIKFRQRRKLWTHCRRRKLWTWHIRHTKLNLIRTRTRRTRRKRKIFRRAAFSSPKKGQDFSPPEKSILNRHRIKYTATRIKYYPPGLNRETFYRTLLPYWNKQGWFLQQIFYSGHFHFTCQKPESILSITKNFRQIKAWNDLYVVERMCSIRVL